VGKYTITLQCIQLNSVVGVFTADIWFTDVTHWQTTDPSTTATLTSLAVSVSPTGWAFVGAPVKFTATMSPATATGKVQFTNTILGGTSNVGPPVTVVNGVATLTLTSLPENLYTFGGKFTPTDPKKFSASTESAQVSYYIRLIEPLSASVKPSLSGTARVGSVLTCKPGTWVGDKTGYRLSFAWLRNLRPISGVTASRYTVRATDGGALIACRVFATNAGGTVSATTNALRVPLAAASRAVKAPTISGTPKVGQVLTAHVGTWTPKPTGYRYQWTRSGVAIRLATRSTFRLTALDRGKHISVIVYAVRTGAATGHSSAKYVVVR
jgi:hypothetical protein